MNFMNWVNIFQLSDFDFIFFLPETTAALRGDLKVQGKKAKREGTGRGNKTFLYPSMKVYWLGIQPVAKDKMGYWFHSLKEKKTKKNPPNACWRREIAIRRKVAMMVLVSCLCWKKVSRKKRQELTLLSFDLRCLEKRKWKNLEGKKENRTNRQNKETVWNSPDACSRFCCVLHFCGHMWVVCCRAVRVFVLSRGLYLCAWFCTFVCTGSRVYMQLRVCTRNIYTMARCFWFWQRWPPSGPQLCHGRGQSSAGVPY